MNLAEKFKSLPKVRSMKTLTEEEQERISNLELSTLESLMILKEILGKEVFASSSLTSKVDFVKNLRSKRLLRNIKG